MESEISSLFYYIKFYKRINYLWDYFSFSVSLTLLYFCLSLLSLCLSLTSLCLSHLSVSLSHMSLSLLLLVKTVRGSEMGKKTTEPHGWAVCSMLPTKILALSVLCSST